MFSNFYMFSRVAKAFGGAALVALLAACAHSISIEPAQLPTRDEARLSPKTVALAINDADRAKRVNSAVGGGDSVVYQPYRDTERGLRSALRSVYRDVVAVPSGADLVAIRSAGAELVFIPDIRTNTDATSLITWAPGVFYVELRCTVLDSAGAVVANLTAKGEGRAVLSEYLNDSSLAARRAVEDALQALVMQIRQDVRLR